jgi:hypothetical protein
MSGRNYRTKKLSEKVMLSKSKKELIAIIRNREHTITSRGSRMGAMYHTIRKLIEEHPDNVVFGRADTTSELIESLKAQLSASRVLLQQRVSNATTTTTTEATESVAANSGSESPSTYSTQSYDCVVCYEKFNKTDHKPIACSCGHILCEACLVAYQASCGSTNREVTCPSCRTVVKSFIPLFF